MKRSTCLLFVAVALAACGGSDKPATTPPAGDDHAKEHAELTPELTAFHDALSPRWHADKGEARMKDTCGAVADFQTKAAAVKAAPAKTGVDATAWAEAGANLETSVTGLETACKGTDLVVFETAFEAVHNAFHHAMELVMGEHSMEGMEHGGMEHGGMEHGDHH